MLKKYFKFLDKKFKKTKANGRVEYVYKTPPASLQQFYDEMCKTKRVYWTPETFAMITYSEGANKKQIKELNEQEKQIFAHKDEYLPFNVEVIPKWYYKLLSTCQCLDIVVGSLYLSSNPIKEMVAVKPKCLNGFYPIGYYGAITPESCPVFTDNSGHIYVIGAKEYRNYPRNKSDKEIQRYLNSEVKLIKEWDSVDDFLIEETLRLEAKFAQMPTLGTIKDVCPCSENSKKFEKNSI